MGEVRLRGLKRCFCLLHAATYIGNCLEAGFIRLDHDWFLLVAIYLLRSIVVVFLVSLLFHIPCIFLALLCPFNGSDSVLLRLPILD